MLKIFPSTATSFQTLGYGVLKDNKTSPLIIEELNGPFTLEFEYSLNGYLSEYLVENNIVVAKTQPFRIINIEKNMESIKVLAKHIFFDLNYNFLEDVAPTELNAQQALDWILARTKETNLFTVNGNCTNISSARYVRKNPIDSIYNDDNCILKRFGGELELDVYNVYVHSKRGTDKGLSIRYEKNLSGIDFKLDFSTVATRIMPQGKDELILDNKYVDSPIINNYFTPIYKKIEFSDIGVDDDTTESQAKQKLIDECNALYTAGIDKPQVSIKIDFVELSKCEEYKDYSNLESCELGDTVSVIIPFLNLNLKTRVVKTTYNDDLKRYVTLELGTVTPNFATNQNKVNTELSNNTESVLNLAKEDARNLINHPFGGNILIDKENGILYLMDSTNPAQAQNVWKWSLGGLGFSNTGINGTYEIAILQNGGINANFITSGKINTTLIEGYGDLILTVNDTIGYKLTEDTVFQDGKDYYSLVNDEYVLYTNYSPGDSIGQLEIYEQIVNEGLNTKVRRAELKLTDYQAEINILHRNIDSEGNVTSVTTGKKYQFNDEGLKIGDSESDFNTLMNNIGFYSKNGNVYLNKTDKDGSIYKDLAIYGTFYYGISEIIDIMNFTKNDANFMQQLEEIDGELCNAHYWNGVE